MRASSVVSDTLQILLSIAPKVLPDSLNLAAASIVPDKLLRLCPGKLRQYRMEDWLWREFRFRGLEDHTSAQLEGFSPSKSFLFELENFSEAKRLEVGILSETGEANGISWALRMDIRNDDEGNRFLSLVLFVTNEEALQSKRLQLTNFQLVVVNEGNRCKSFIHRGNYDHSSNLVCDLKSIVALDELERSFLIDDALHIHLSIADDARSDIAGLVDKTGIAVGHVLVAPVLVLIDEVTQLSENSEANRNKCRSLRRFLSGVSTNLTLLRDNMSWRHKRYILLAQCIGQNLLKISSSLEVAKSVLENRSSRSYGNSAMAIMLESREVQQQQLKPVCQRIWSELVSLYHLLASGRASSVVGQLAEDFHAGVEPLAAIMPIVVPEKLLLRTLRTVEGIWEKVLFKLECFSRLMDIVVRSDEVEVGGISWGLLMGIKEDGVGGNRYLSLYLCVVEEEALWTGWQQTVDFELVIVNQGDSSKSIHRGKDNQVFNSNNLSCGFKKVVAICNPDEGFLVNNSLQILLSIAPGVMRADIVNLPALSSAKK